MSAIQSRPVNEPPADRSDRGLQAIALANAVTTVAVIAFVLCAALALVAPDLFVGLVQPWLHGLSLAPLRPVGPWFRPDEFILGIVTFGGSAWLVTAAIAGLYNRWSRR